VNVSGALSAEKVPAAGWQRIIGAERAGLGATGAGVGGGGDERAGLKENVCDKRPPRCLGKAE